MQISFFAGFQQASPELTFMAVEAIKSSVVAVAGVGGVAFDALPAVPAGDGGIETLAGTVPPDALLLVHFPLQIKRNPVHA